MTIAANPSVKVSPTWGESVVSEVTRSDVYEVARLHTRSTQARYRKPRLNMPYPVAGS